jgi:hypothetical protein
MTKLVRSFCPIVILLGTVTVGCHDVNRRLSAGEFTCHGITMSLKRNGGASVLLPDGRRVELFDTASLLRDKAFANEPSRVSSAVERAIADQAIQALRLEGVLNGFISEISTQTALERTRGDELIAEIARKMLANKEITFTGIGSTTLQSITIPIPDHGLAELSKALGD